MAGPASGSRRGAGAARSRWVQSYVTDDKITCVYIAPSAELIREHAWRGGFPADRVLEVSSIIYPATAEPHGLLA